VASRVGVEGEVLVVAGRRVEAEGGGGPWWGVVAVGGGCVVCGVGVWRPAALAAGRE
jgi:hypothetical protein